MENCLEAHISFILAVIGCLICYILVGNLLAIIWNLVTDFRVVTCSVHTHSFCISWNWLQVFGNSEIDIMWKWTVCRV